MLPRETQEQILELHRGGMPERKIAAAVGTSRSSVRFIIQRGVAKKAAARRPRFGVGRLHRCKCGGLVRGPCLLCWLKERGLTR